MHSITPLESNSPMAAQSLPTVRDHHHLIGMPHATPLIKRLDGLWLPSGTLAAFGALHVAALQHVQDARGGPQHAHPCTHPCMSCMLIATPRRAMHPPHHSHKCMRACMHALCPGYAMPCRRLPPTLPPPLNASHPFSAMSCSP